MIINHNSSHSSSGHCGNSSSSSIPLLLVLTGSRRLGTFPFPYIKPTGAKELITPSPLPPKFDGYSNGIYRPRQHFYVSRNSDASTIITTTSCGSFRNEVPLAML